MAKMIINGKEVRVARANIKEPKASKSGSNDLVIKPCPFCGNSKVDIMGTDIIGDINIVACANSKCGAEIGKLTEKEAIEAWQKRAL